MVDPDCLSGASELVGQHGGGGLPREPWIGAIEPERQTLNSLPSPRRTPQVCVWEGRRAVEVVHVRCAGLDISKRDAKVCVRIAGAGRRKTVETVTTWGSMTSQVLALRDHLIAERITCLGCDVLQQGQRLPLELVRIPGRFAFWRGRQIRFCPPTAPNTAPPLVGVLCCSGGRIGGLMGDQAVERVLRRSGFGLQSGGNDVALGSRHGFVTEKFYECVDADIGVGEFGGVGVSQRVHECTRGAVGVGAGQFEGAQDAILQGPPGDSVAVIADEQWCAGRPGLDRGAIRATAGPWPGETGILELRGRR